MVSILPSFRNYIYIYIYMFTKLLAFAQQERQNPVSAHIMWTPAHPIAGEVCFVDLSQIFPVLIRILPISANGD